jgi:hypothetical protein
VTRGARVLAVLALVVATSCAAPATACAPVAGGEPGSVMQFRGMRFGDDQVSFVFGLRAGGAQYGVPEHAVERDGDLVRVRIPGARLRNTDGSPSYRGERDVTPPGTGITAVSVTEGRDEGLTFDLRVGGRGCPRLLSRRYILGTTHPEAVVSVSLRDAPMVVLDPDRGPMGSPTQVVGLGMSPSSPVTFQYAGRTVWTSRSDVRGLLDTILYVPTADAGWHRVLVRDHSRATTVWFRSEPE